MLTWEDEKIAPNTVQISTNKVILVGNNIKRAHSMLKYFDALLVNRYARPFEITVVKPLCASVKQTIQSFRFDMHSHLQIAKCREKRTTPVRNVGFNNTCKLNLRNAP